MSKFITLFLGVLAVCLIKVNANFKPEVRAAILKAVTPVVEKCSEENDVTYDQLQAAQIAGREVEDLPIRFLECMARNTGVTSSDGVYNTDTALDLLEDLVGDDFPIYKERAKQCGYVNDQTYSDGTRRYEIAKAVFICYRQVGVEIVLTELPPQSEN